jgi:ubiquitin-protein ligase
MTWDQPNVPLSHSYFLNKHDNQSIVQWKVALLEPNSTTVYDAGFFMIAVMFKFKLTL